MAIVVKAPGNRKDCARLHRGMAPQGTGTGLSHAVVFAIVNHNTDSTGWGISPRDTESRIMAPHNAGAWERESHTTRGAHPVSVTTPMGFILPKKEEIR